MPSFLSEPAAAKDMAKDYSPKYHLHITNIGERISHAYLYEVEFPNPVSAGDAIDVICDGNEIRCIDANVRHNLRTKTSLVELVSKEPSQEFEEIFKGKLQDYRRVF